MVQSCFRPSIGQPESHLSAFQSGLPCGANLKELCEQQSVCNRSGREDDLREAGIQREMEQYGDIIRVNVLDAHDNLSEKTLKLFTLLLERFHAHFYFKIDDDVAVNMEALTEYLETKRGQSNLYMVSGTLATADDDLLGLCVHNSCGAIPMYR